MMRVDVKILFEFLHDEIHFGTHIDNLHEGRVWHVRRHLIVDAQNDIVGA